MKTILFLTLALTTASVFADEQTSLEIILAAQQSVDQRAASSQATEVQQPKAQKSGEQAAWFEALVKACGKTGSLDVYAVPTEVTATVMQVLVDVLAVHNKCMQQDPAYAHDCWS